MAEINNARSFTAIAVAIAVGTFMSWAGSDVGARAGAVPVFALCGALAFVINWLAFIPAALTQSERFYDLVGGITYVAVTMVAVLLSGEMDVRAALVAAMVMAWSIRLATFLFRRILRSGRDNRFDEIKTHPPRFLMAWTIQGLWVLMTAAAALAVITGGVREPLGPVGFIGIAVWAFGFVIEIVADWQKARFKSNPGNQGQFINAGLWRLSRHPNYFGEIVLWTGIALIALPVLQGWQYATLISPVFVAVLLIKVSGIPMLEDKADERWGGQDDYKAYKRRTPVLIPKPDNWGQSKN